MEGEGGWRDIRRLTSSLVGIQISRVIFFAISEISRVFEVLD